MAHKPTTELRKQVLTFTSFGIPETDTAAVLGIDPKTLRKHYSQELDIGHVKANVVVAQNLYKIATGTGREAVTAAIFWLKTRAGWRERDHVLPANGYVSKKEREADEARSVATAAASEWGDDLNVDVRPN